MRLRLLDLLACPHCRHFPLTHYVFEKNIEEAQLPDKPPLCELYCAYVGERIENYKNTPPCHECIKLDVVSGILICTSCGSWYPIIDSIPRMLPPGHPVRSDKQYVKVLSRFRNMIPEEYRAKILGEGGE